MARWHLSAAAALLFIAPIFAGSFEQSTDANTNGQNSQDVPKQQPGTNNPDVSKQRPQEKPTPSTGSTQQAQDVPQQKPGANNPDVAKQRHRPSAKKKSRKSTGDTSSTQP